VKHPEYNLCMGFTRCLEKEIKTFTTCHLIR
jgi:hypothetical protein